MSPALLALCLSAGLASLGTSIANVGLPTLAREWDASFLAVRWVVLSYLLSLTALAVFAGRLGDRFGHRRLLLAGIALFALGSLACAAAPTLGWLLAARVAQGAGAAAMSALALALAPRSLPPGKTGTAMGWLGSTSAIGTAAGPALGGALIDGFGWRAMFALLFALGSLALLAGRAALSVEAEARGPRERKPFAFDARVTAGLAANVLVSTVVMSTLVVGPFHLAGALALGAAGIGAVMTAGPLVAALVGPLAGRWVDRAGHERLALGALGLMAVGAALLAAFAASSHLASYVLPLVVLTAAYALFQSANNTGVMTAASSADRGTVSGALNLSRNAGLIAGAWIMANVFDFGATGGVAAGTRATFALASVLALIAMAAIGLSTRFSRQARPSSRSRAIRARA